MPSCFVVSRAVLGSIVMLARQCQSSLFPTNTAKREKWVKSINRSHFVPGKRSVLCIKYFDVSHTLVHGEKILLAREYPVIKPSNGTVLTVKRVRIKLTPEFVPSMFYVSI